MIRSAGGWSEAKKSQHHRMSDERILGDSEFVSATLSQAAESLIWHYELKALGFDLQHLATKAAEIFLIERDKICNYSAP